MPKPGCAAFSWLAHRNPVRGPCAARASEQLLPLARAGKLAAVAIDRGLQSLVPLDRSGELSTGLHLPP